MRVEAREVELAGDQEDDGAHGVEPGVAAGLALGGLEQAVDGFFNWLGDFFG